MNDLKTAIDSKIVQHEAAIVVSGQSTDGAHARLTALVVELFSFLGSTQTAIAEVKSAGDTTRKETIEEFLKFRESIELWYAGIKVHLEKNGGGGDGNGKGGGDGKGSTRVDKKDIAVWKLQTARRPGQVVLPPLGRRCRSRVGGRARVQAREFRHE